MVAYVLNIFNSIFCCPDIRKLKMTFTSQNITGISLSKYVFHKCWILTIFYFENFNHQQLQVVQMIGHIFFF